MANYATVKAQINANIKNNNNQEITGAILNGVLLQMVQTLADGGYLYKGVATPTTAPGTPDANVFYICPPGTYSNFGSAFTVPAGQLGIVAWDGSWAQSSLPVGKDYDEAIAELTAQVGAVFDDYIQQEVLTEYTPLNYYIASATGNWSTNSGYKHGEIAVEPGSYLKVTASANNYANVSFLKTNARTAGAAADLSDEYADVHTVTVPAGTSKFFRVPDDAHYFYFYMGLSSQGYPYAPAAVSLLSAVIPAQTVKAAVLEVADLRNDVGTKTIVTETADCSQTTWVSGNILAVSGDSMGRTGSSTANSHTDYIELPGVGAWRRTLVYTRGVTTASSSNAGLVFYDRNKKALDFQKMAVNGSAMGYQSETLPVPQTAAYIRTTLNNSFTGDFSAVLTIENELYTGGLGARVDTLDEEVAELQAIAPGDYKPYNVVGSPVPYIPTVDTSGLSVFSSVQALYAAWDALAALYPDWLKKENSIGMDASNTYEIRHYTLRWQHPLITNDRAGDGQNLWSDTLYKYRRIIVNMSIHADEKYSTLGGYLAIKAILESMASQPWAQFIRDNFVLDLVPCSNPWGLDNGSKNNANGYNLNRTFYENVQAENTALKNLITSLKPKGLVGVIDLHNTGLQDSGGNSYFVSKPSYTFWNYYAVLVQQLQALLWEFTESMFGTTRDNHFHLWDGSENSGQLHQYVNDQGLLGGTVEVSSGRQIAGSFLTVAQVINLINAFGTFTNV